jgi:hypothetical protein
MAPTTKLLTPDVLEALLPDDFKGKYIDLQLIDRPGDAPYAFTSSTDGGATRDLPVLSRSTTTNANGATMRVAEADVAMRKVEAIESGKVYRVRFKLQRAVNTRDPDNDAIQLGLVCLSNTKTKISELVFLTITDRSASSGEFEQTFTIGGSVGDLVQFALPGNTRYAQGFVRTFGTTPLTDINVIEIIRGPDIDAQVATAVTAAQTATTEAGISTAQAAAAQESATEADSSRQLAASYVSTAVAQGNVPILGTWTAVAGLPIPAGLNTLRVSGRNAENDGGGCWLRRISASSATSATIASSGSKTLTVPAGLEYYKVGARVGAISTGSGAYMGGVITAYSGTTLVFTADTSSGSGAHTDWLISSAPSHNLYTTSNSGMVFWELRPDDQGVVNAKAAGMIADNATDNLPVFNNIIGYLAAKSWVATSSIYRGSYTVKIPAGHYYSSGTWEFAGGVSAQWLGDSDPANLIFAATVIEFPADTVGFRIQAYDTILDTTQTGGINHAGTGTRIRGIAVHSAGGTDRTKHGIWVRQRTYIDEFSVYNFPGNGLHVQAAVPGVGILRGNDNLCHFSRGRLIHNGGSGIYADGPDANVCSFTAMESENNGAYGYWESSFLANTYINCHADANGRQGSGTTTNPNVGDSLWYYDTDCTPGYYGILEGKETLAVTTPPSDPSVWYNVIPVTYGPGVLPSQYYWASGVQILKGGSFRSDGSAASLFLGCYAEGGQAGAYIINGSVMLGGLAPAPTPDSNGASILVTVADGLILRRPVTSDVRTIGTTTIPSISHKVTMGGQVGGSGQLLTAINSKWSPLIHRWQYNGTSGDIEFSYASSTVLFTLTVPLTTVTYGGVSPRPNQMQMPLLNLGATALTSRSITFAASPPTTGEGVRGNIVFNYNIAKGQNVGWVNLTTGYNGTPAAWASGTAYAIGSFANNGSVFQLTAIASTPWTTASHPTVGQILSYLGGYFTCTVAGSGSSVVPPSVGAMADGYSWALTKSTVAPAVGLRSDGYTWAAAVASQWVPFGIASPAPATGVASAGTNIAGATQIDFGITVVTSNAAGAGVKLPIAPTAGVTEASILNQSANALLVYPGAGNSINSLGTSAPISVAAGATLFMKAATSTLWLAK